MTDDQGYRDVGCFGHPQIKTPVLDKTATEGVKLTHFYAAASVCTPTRMGLMTGCYPRRVGWPGYVLGYKISHDQGLNPDEVTMAEVLRTKGYATGCFGNWHIGTHVPFLPTNQGFDTYFGIPYSNNMSPKVLIRDDQVSDERFDNRLLTQRFTEEAIKFIKHQKGKPFFLYLPYSAPRFPVQPHPDWKGKSAFGKYGDVIEAIDWSVGQLLAALEQQKIDQHTLMVFISDNGPQEGQQAQKSSAAPLRGMKWDAYEGGHRVPCIMRWPTVLKPGIESTAVVSMIDLLPTFARIAHIPLKEVVLQGHPLDGLDVWDAIRGTPGKENAREHLLYWHGQGAFTAIRSGEWKLFPNQNELYDLSMDMSEKNNVADQHPEIVASLKATSQEMVREIEENIRPMADIKKQNRAKSPMTFNVGIHQDGTMASQSVQ